MAVVLMKIVDIDKPVQISKHLIQDSRLSANARMLCIYLLSFSDASGLTDEYIRQELNVGRDKLQGMFRELREHGYMQVVTVKGDNGRINGSTRNICAIPKVVDK